MPETDDFILAALEGRTQEPTSRQAERLQRQRFVVEFGANFAELQAEARPHFIFEADAFDDVALDRDAHQAFLIGLGDQTMRLQARHAEPLGDFALGEPRAIMQPGRANAEVVVLAIGGFGRLI